MLTLSKGTYTLSAYVKARNMSVLLTAETGAGIWVAQKKFRGDYKMDMDRSLTGTTDSDFDDGWVG